MGICRKKLIHGLSAFERKKRGGGVEIEGA
jgi:hypothetical protein